MKTGKMFLTVHVIRVSFFLLILQLSILPNAIGLDENPPPIKPDHEKRSCIQSVDGYAYMGDNTTPAQARDTAYINAKRLAVEMATTYIQSKTTVENFVLKKDLVEGTAEGAVTVLEQKDFGLEENLRYHVWIKAEVEYTLKSRKSAGTEKTSVESGTTVTVKGASAPLTVKVWSSKKKYKQGEAIEIFIQGNRDYYARIIDLMSSGDIIQLLPNDFRTNNFFKGGKTYKIPNAQDRFQLKATPPLGSDRIIVYASEVPLGKIDTSAAGGGLRSIKGSQETLAKRTRGIAVVSSEKKARQRAEFYEVSCSFQTGK